MKGEQKMKAVIMSIGGVSDKEAKQVTEILQESKCPNESLGNTFPERFYAMEEEGPTGLLTVYFDGGMSAVEQEKEIEY